MATKKVEVAQTSDIWEALDPWIYNPKLITDLDIGERRWKMCYLDFRVKTKTKTKKRWEQTGCGESLDWTRDSERVNHFYRKDIRPVKFQLQDEPAPTPLWGLKEEKLM